MIYRKPKQNLFIETCQDDQTSNDFMTGNGRERFMVQLNLVSTFLLF